MSQRVLPESLPPFNPSANSPREGGLDTRGNRMGWPSLFRRNKGEGGEGKTPPTPGIVPNTWRGDELNGGVTRPANQAGEHGGGAGLDRIRSRFSGLEMSQLGLLWARAAPRRPGVSGEGGGRSDTTRQSGIRAALEDGGDGRAGTPQRTGRAAVGREGSQAHRGSCHAIYAA